MGEFALFVLGGVVILGLAGWGVYRLVKLKRIKIDTSGLRDGGGKGDSEGP